jgi:signal transduction histidine kinase
MWLPSAVFAGLWILERRVRERADTALAQYKSSLEQHRAANEQLRAINHVQSKFIADAAHELRAPLNSLKLRVHLLENGHPEKHAEYLNDLKAQLDRLARLSEDLLDISRLEVNRDSDAFAPVDLNTVVEQVVITYRPLAEAAGLSLVFERTPELPPVSGQRSQLAQVGSNLVANAINYTPAGHVHVITTLAADLKRVCLLVQDTGIGIAGEDIPHLFERFYRGQKPDGMQQPGTGLGLSIVKEIVDQHGGSIEVESQPGVGSIFKVCLPLA